jgi:hypothetical protein
MKRFFKFLHARVIFIVGLAFVLPLMTLMVRSSTPIPSDMWLGFMLTIGIVVLAFGPYLAAESTPAEGEENPPAPSSRIRSVGVGAVKIALMPLLILAGVASFSFLALTMWFLVDIAEGVRTPEIFGVMVGSGIIFVLTGTAAAGLAKVLK